MRGAGRIGGCGGVERDVAELAALAGLRLRFDRVVARVIGMLKANLAEVIPDGQALVVTITAPIRHPAKTAAALEALVRGGQPDGEVSATVFGNAIRIRRVAGVPPSAPNLLCFVHNPASDAPHLLDLAEARLLA